MRKSNLAAAVALCNIFLLAGASPHTWPVLALTVLASCAVLGCLFFFACWQSDRDTTDPLGVDSSMPATAPTPWDRMRHLMEISGQRLPEEAVLTNHGILYACLNMEELGETIAGVCRVLERMDAADTANFGVRNDRVQLMRVIRGRLVLLAGRLQTDARRLREWLTLVGDFEVHLLLDEAAEILDGTSDLAVTNCGFALACGFDGAAGYEEAQDSNLSKANPDTGRIDKMPDGKWIKGRQYREADFSRVLRNTAHERINAAIRAC